MIISDLNHVEVVSEETETSIVGGYHYSFLSSTANAGAYASAYGPGSYTSAFTSTYTSPFSASSSSGSYSSNSFYPYYWY